MVSITVDGDLTGSTVERWKTVVKAQIPGLKDDVILNLSGVELIDSKGLGFLFNLFSDLAINQKKLQLSGVSPDILQLLKSMRIDQHIQIL